MRCSGPQPLLPPPRPAMTVRLAWPPPSIWMSWYAFALSVLGRRKDLPAHPFAGRPSSSDSCSSAPFFSRAPWDLIAKAGPGRCSLRFRRGWYPVPCINELLPSNPNEIEPAPCESACHPEEQGWCSSSAGVSKIRWLLTGAGLLRRVRSAD